jgi:hypothetical protein
MGWLICSHLTKTVEWCMLGWQRAILSMVKLDLWTGVTIRGCGGKLSITTKSFSEIRTRPRNSRTGKEEVNACISMGVVLWHNCTLYILTLVHGTRRLIIVFIRASNWTQSWASWIQSTPWHYIFKCGLILSSQPFIGLPSCLFPSCIPTKILN